MNYQKLLLYSILWISTIFSASEKKFIILIPSYNNPLSITRECLQSALNQNYSNFEILFSDDCSPQPDIENIHRSLIAELDTNHRITYRRNQQRCGPIGNQWMAFHSINPDNTLDNREIVIANLDGDDMLEPDALKIANELHQKGAWVTWGQFALYPSGDKHNDCKEVSKKIIAKNGWRSIPGGLATSHLRTYRLSLIKDLPIQALFYHGNFYPASGDAPLMWSLCEKAGIHTAYNPEIIYQYRQTYQSESRMCGQLSTDCANYARNQPSFKPLEELPIQYPAEQYKASLIIFSYKRPLQLYALLESLQEYVTGFHQMYVLYRTDNTQFEDAYKKVNADFKDIKFIKQSKKPEHDFKPMLLDIIHQSHSDYIMFATDDNIVKDHVSITACIQALQKTHAYGFHLRLGLNITYFSMLNKAQNPPILINIGDDIFAWQHATAPDYWSDWSWINTVDMTLYPKNEIINALAKLSYQNPNTLEGEWANLLSSLKQKVGLCFKESKIINIPLNRVQSVYPTNKSMSVDPLYLLNQFNAGYKMDRKPFFQLANQDSHTECAIGFVKR